MPIYTFKSNVHPFDEWEDIMKVSELEEYREDNDCSVVIQYAASIRKGDGKDLYSRSDSDFRNRMKNLKKFYPESEGLKDW